MKVLKKKFRKITIGKKLKVITPDTEGIVIKPIINRVLKPIKIKPKLGRWCEYYEGRIPYPIECSSNKDSPVSCYFQDGEKYIVKDRSNCETCNRFVEWRAWKDGAWDKIKEAIKKGEDLSDMKSPFQGE